MTTETARSQPVRTFAGTLTVIGAALMFSINNIAIPGVYQHGSEPLTLVTLRYAFHCLLILVFAIVAGQQLWLSRQHLLGATATGAASVLAVFGLLASIARLPVSLAILILYTYPILVGLFSAVVNRKSPGIGQFLCLAAALAGVAVSLQIDHFVLDPVGLGFASFSAICYAISIVWSGRSLNDAAPLALSLHMAIVGLVLSALLVFAGTGLQPPAGLTGWLFFGVCAIGFSGGFLGIYRGVQLIGPLPASMLMNLEPVVTTGLAFLLLGEPLTPQKLTGAGIVVSAVLVSQWLSVRQPSAALSS